jgi:hypothetical protein
VHWYGATSLPESDLFCKQAAAGKGAGADTWEYVGFMQWRGMDGRLRDEASLIMHVSEASLSNPLLLQVKLRNLADIQPLSAGGISSLRVMTSIDPQTSEIQVMAATLKILKTGQVTDHWSLGGRACGVDIKNGVLRSARYRHVSLTWEDAHEHPDTGELITGRRLALWQEVMSLTKRAHHHFRQYPSLGWDVAMTPDGPVLLEGNLGWDARLIQQPCDYPLGAPAFFKDYYPWYENAMKLGKALLDLPLYHGWKHSLMALGKVE